MRVGKRARGSSVKFRKIVFTNREVSPKRVIGLTQQGGIMKKLNNARGASLKALATTGVALAFVVALGVGPASAQTVIVVNDDTEGDPKAPSPCNEVPDYATIQEAINNASSGDVINICPGNYPEDLTIATDGLTLECTNTKKGKAVIEGQATHAAADFPLASPNIDIQANMTTIADCTITVPGGPGQYGSGIVIGGTNNAIIKNHISCEAGDPGTVCLQTWNSAALGGVPPDISGSFFGLNEWSCEESGDAFGCEGLFINPQSDPEDFMSIVGNHFSGQFYRLMGIARPKVAVALNEGKTDIKGPLDTADFGTVPVGIKLFGAGNLFGGAGNKANTTDSLVLENKIKRGKGKFYRGIWVEDRGADGAATGNLLKQNVAKSATEWDCLDETTGGLTAGTANLWAENVGKKASPDGICEKRKSNLFDLFKHLDKFFK
jgi:hypothetical protein